MEGAANQIDANLFENIQHVKETQTSAPVESPKHAFLVKHLHPPSAVPSYEGIPTNDSRTQVIANWVQFGVVNASRVIDPGTGIPVEVPSENIQGFAFLVTSGLNHGVITFVRWKRANGSVVWDQDLNNTLPLDVYGIANFRTDAMKFRPAYRSLTTYLNATMFSNIGAFAGAQFNPSVLFGGTLVGLSQAHPRAFKKIIESKARAGHTCGDMSAFDAHIVKSFKEAFDSAHASIKNDKTDDYYIVDEKPIKLDPNTSLQILDFGKIGNPVSGNSLGAVVPTLGQVMNMSTRSYGGKAMDGSFGVSRLNTAAPKWYAAGTERLIPGAANDGLYELWIAYEAFDGGDRKSVV